NDWLVRFIKSANSMIEEGEPQAVAVFEKYDKEKMPDTDLTLGEIQAVIDYVISFNKSAAQAAKPEKQSAETTAVIKNGVSAIEPRSEVLSLGGADSENVDARLDAIETKIDALFEYHKKSLFARITPEEIARGQDLFQGVITFENNAPACVSCHNTSDIDTLNWNPSALDIAIAFSDRSNADMAHLVVNPESDKMKEVLMGHTLTDDESFYITAYLESIRRAGLNERKDMPINLVLFLGFSVVGLLALLDLMFFKLVKYKQINVAVLLVAGVFLIEMMYTASTNISISQNYSPDQPIKFSHKIHVQENKIECMFCHNTPEFSRESGVPTTNVCMICHNKITSGVHSGKFEINKIIESYENNESIEWVKVHNLPDHVFFSHAQHVSVGKIKCQECHGPVEEMDVTRQYATLSMGWCVNCHKEKEVQFIDNQYYSNHNELHEKLKFGEIKSVTADKIGANDCQKCHY
ncbi:MAG: cytochrome c family protein, partial [Saprospiraceae bacterium]|nr:cytochrome c family protein [Saprospiraceae bacterium]